MNINFKNIVLTLTILLCGFLNILNLKASSVLPVTFRNHTSLTLKIPTLPGEWCQINAQGKRTANCGGASTESITLASGGSFSFMDKHFNFNRNMGNYVLFIPYNKDFTVTLTSQGWGKEQDKQITVKGNAESLSPHQMLFPYDNKEGYDEVIGVNFKREVTGGEKDTHVKSWEITFYEEIVDVKGDKGPSPQVKDKKTFN